jgi:hypothetical protein
MTEPRSIWDTDPSRSAPTEPAPPSRRALPFALAALGLVVVAAVVAAVLVLRSDRGRAVASQRPPTSSTPSRAPSPSIAAVGNLSARAEPFAVVLTWTQPAGVTPVEGYGIFRDGVELTTIPPASMYTDTSVEPGKDYGYEVEPRGAAGSVVGPRTTVSATTPVPSMRSARVEGDFTVKVKVVSQKGFETFTNSYTLGWHFEPTCATGPCDVEWTDLAESSLQATLSRAGVSYSGSDSGKFNVRCNDAEVKSTLSVAFDVTKAKGIDGEWRATTLKGTLTETEDAQLGCVASKAVLSITATLVT